MGISGQEGPSFWGKQRLTLPFTEALFQKTLQIHSAAAAWVGPEFCLVYPRSGLGSNERLIVRT